MTGSGLTRQPVNQNAAARLKNVLPGRCRAIATDAKAPALACRDKHFVEAPDRHFVEIEVLHDVLRPLRGGQYIAAAFFDMVPSARIGIGSEFSGASAALIRSPGGTAATSSGPFGASL